MHTIHELHCTFSHKGIPLFGNKTRYLKISPYVYQLDWNMLFMHISTITKFAWKFRENQRSSSLKYSIISIESLPFSQCNPPLFVSETCLFEAFGGWLVNCELPPEGDDNCVEQMQGGYTYIMLFVRNTRMHNFIVCAHSTVCALDY
jgi:hypothetical protein